MKSKQSCAGYITTNILECTETMHINTEYSRFQLIFSFVKKKRMKSNTDKNSDKITDGSRQYDTSKTLPGALVILSALVLECKIVKSTIVLGTIWKM